MRENENGILRQWLFYSARNAVCGAKFDFCKCCFETEDHGKNEKKIVSGLCYKIIDNF